MKKRQWKASIFIKNIMSNEYLLILFNYLMFMTFYWSILYLDMDTWIFQHVKILARKKFGDMKWLDIWYHLCHQHVHIEDNHNMKCWKVQARKKWKKKSWVRCTTFYINLWGNAIIFCLQKCAFLHF
jgi:hypothetical protein